MVHLFVLVSVHFPGRRCGVLRSHLVLGVLLPLLAQKPIVVQSLTVRELEVIEIQPLPVNVIALDLMYFLLELLYAKLAFECQLKI